MRYLTRFLAIAAIAAAPTFASAEDYYVWVDENGVTNYSERNPQGYDAMHVTRSLRFGEQIRTPQEENEMANRPSGSRPGANVPTEPTQPDQPDPGAMIEAERAAIAAQIAATKRQNCEIGKRNLASLEAFARIRVSDENGGERVLTDEEKAERIETARQTIRENCTG